MTQLMVVPAWVLLLLLAFPFAGRTSAQEAAGPVRTQQSQTAAGDPGASDEDYRVYTDPPRLLLASQRLRLLKRERQRQSIRWQQFEALVQSGEPLPEPGFVWALYYRISGDEAVGRKAVEWALRDAPGPVDARQLAFVFDWCGPVMSPDQTGRLAAKLQAFLTARPTSTASLISSLQSSGSDIPVQSARALVAIALADQLPDHGEAVLKSVVQQWWRGNIVQKIAAGEPAIPREQIYPIYELMNVVRDNLKIDMRESSSDYFQILPTDHLMSHYPGPLQTQDDEYRVQAYTHPGDPNITDQVFSRAAEMAMVALDSNAPEIQYVQGWLMQDRFMMRGALGNPYEFLWANPYQPGLSYAKEPLLFHNPATGHVFARTDWGEDATWIGYFDGHLQLFRDGQIQTLKVGSVTPPVRVGDALVVMASNRDSIKFHADAADVVVLSLVPKSFYEVEVDDQELMEGETDVGGTLVLTLPSHTNAGVRLQRTN